MAGAGTLTVRILGDTAPLKKSLGEAEGAANTFGTKLSSIGSKMQSFGKKASIGLTLPIVAAGKVMFDAASDMAESQNKVNVVFGKNAAVINAWAKNAAKNMGMSRQEALNTAGTFGNLFTQMDIGTHDASQMTQQMGILAADLGSFHNADPTEVIESMTAAFRGEYDSVQKYIPTINAAAVHQKALAMTGKKTTAELTDQDKVIATHKLLLEGAGKATGDWARTQDSATNKQRTAKAQMKDAVATLGTALLPVMQKVIGVVSSLAEKFNRLSPGMQKAILIGGGLLAVLGPLVGVIGTIITAVKGLSVAMAFLAANPIVLVIAALVALGAGLVVLYQKSETFRDIVNGAFHAVIYGATIMRDLVVTYVQTIVDKWLAAVEWIVRGAAAAFGWVPGIGGKLKDAAKKIEEFRDDVNAKLDGIKDKTIKVHAEFDIGAAAAMFGAPAGRFGIPKPRAQGGPVTPSGTYLVGEQGPELFRPSTAGAIVPNDRFGGGGGGVTVQGPLFEAHIHASEMPTDRQIEYISRKLMWHLGSIGGM